MSAAALILACGMVVSLDGANPLVPPTAAVETLLRQAASFQQSDQVDSARMYARRAFDLTVGEPGVPDRLAAEVFDRLGQVFLVDAAYDSAGAYLNRALAAAEAAEADTLIADILVHAGKGYRGQRAWGQAAACLQRALKIKETLFGADSPALIDVLSAAANVAYKQYHYMEAEPLCRRLIFVVTAAEGPTSPRLIDAYSTLAWSGVCQMQFDAAQADYRQAIVVAERQPTVDQAGLAQLYARLCQAYFNAGGFIAAEEAGRRGLKIAEEHLGPNDRATAEVMTQLVGLYSIMKKFDVAERYARRVLAIRQSLKPGDSEEVAQSLAALMFVYAFQRQYAEAEAYARMSCDMLLRLFGPEDPTLLRRQQELTQICILAGHTAEAGVQLEAIIPTMEKVLGPAAGTTVWAVNLLAGVRIEQKRFAEAEALMLDKVAAMERAYGPRYNFIGYSLESLVDLYLSTKEPEKALQYGERLLLLRQDLAQKKFVCSSEGEKLSWVEQNPVLIPQLIMLALEHPGSSADSVVFDMVLQGKAIVFDAVMEEKKAAFCSSSSLVQGEISTRARLCTAIADLATEGGEGNAPDGVRERLMRLYDSLEFVEADLSRQCSDFGTAMAERRVSFAQVNDFLPSGAALLEYVKYAASLPPLVDTAGEYVPEMHYLVCTLDRVGRISLTDLGDAVEIDSLIGAARTMLYDAERRVYSPMAPYLEDRLNEVTGVLYQRLVAPVEKTLAGASEWLIAPDGMLNLLPFEILHRPDGSYLIEREHVSYLSSGRDLVRFYRQPAAGREAVVLGDPDYDATPDTPPAPTPADPSLFASLVSPHAAGGTADGPPIRERRFLPLQYSRSEATAIAAAIAGKGRLPVRELYGMDAREEAVKHMPEPPLILHLATHGFFTASNEESSDRISDNPLLQSGLALAGVNRLAALPTPDSAETDNGILTALEVSGLDLHGTELVSLSACESGVGKPSTGEGIFGLRRAFLHAGAQSLVMSLWKVPDQETADLMTRFYNLWLGGMSRSEALRTAELDMLAKTRVEKGHGHPLFWGGFVLIGDPR